MILSDAGPLVAILCGSDELHQAAVNALRGLGQQPLTTTLPCFAEAMHMVRTRKGVRGQHILWRWWHDGRLRLLTPPPTELVRMSEPMAKYSDLPMDLGDASLVAAAEELGVRSVFTFDGDFRIYRLFDGSVLEIVP